MAEMTREQAIAAARQHVVEMGLPVQLEPEEVRLLDADRFNWLFGEELYPCDFWVVDFRKILPPGIVVQNPCTVTIQVMLKTGETREVYLGMESDLKARRAAERERQ